MRAAQEARQPAMVPVHDHLLSSRQRLGGSSAATMSRSARPPDRRQPGRHQPSWKLATVRHFYP